MKVKSLYQLAVEAVYKGIVLSPLTSYKTVKSENEEPGAKKRKFDESALVTSIIQEVRKLFDENLVTDYRQVRELMMEAYNHHSVRLDICQFLDCILDDKFQSLCFEQGDFPSSMLTEDGKFYLVQVVNTIARHCPSFQKIVFPSFATKKLPKPSEALFVTALGRLRNLTTLKLDWKTKSACIEFFTHLGSSCPNLEKLCLKEMPFQLEQQLALVLGSKAELIPLFLKKIMWGNHNLQHVQFPIENISPICHSIKHLSIKSKGNVSLKQQTYSTAFILCHFLKLQKLTLKFDAEIANDFVQATSILLLYSLLRPNKFARNNEFFYQDNQFVIKWNSNYAPTQTLNLIELEMVNPRHSKVLEAIIFMCPHLTTTLFLEWPDDINQYFYDFTRNFSNNLLDGIWSNDHSAQQLQKALSGQLPQMRNVIFDEVSSDYREAVLSSLGGQLTDLSFWDCPDLLPSQLTPCIGLEKLDVSGCTLPLLSHSIEDITLPNLKQLTCYTCPAESSRLLEMMLIPSLTQLHLECAHFGIAGASNFNWEDVPRLYPNLKEFKLSIPCRSLTLETVRRISTQLPCLEFISLPLEMLEQDQQEMSEKLIVELEQRKFPIKLQFTEKGKENCCFNN